MLIFLDLDGVLNKESDWSRKYVINQECFSYFVNAKTGFCKGDVKSAYRIVR